MKSLLNRSMKEQKPLVIIYLAKDGAITQRKIIVKSLSSSAIYAYCFQRRSTRSFLLSNILAAYPADSLKRKRGIA
ncbi:putative DNA-binding transcriptional regulator YafY [Bacillus ectoiniformans]|uniref:hypothetical protein n=1 Tax=Bacillus ectoiniformans TaxID=1494429 RepID=UPI00195848F5|nr:hypothetical protein [Bacillus ectoiniformans]MBM7647510.1 putative DNA-binding transcriptional regulator YafY [Bacillus ectoiniformans]